MYTTVRGLPQSEGADPAAVDAAPEPAGTKKRKRPRVPRVVLLLGTVSLFTDLSSEMVVAILPVYLTLVLGLTPLQYGLIDGIYQGVTAAVRIVGGLGADLTRRPKLVAIAGYGLSFVCKIFFLPAHSFAAISALVAIDRSGKGLRTAPRDAMIAESSPAASLGYNFGVHRTMDTIGALGGPLIAFGILAYLTTTAAYDAIFVLSFALAGIGVAILVLFVPDLRPGAAPATPAPDAAGAEAGADAAVKEPKPAREKGALRRAVRDVAGLTKLPHYRRTMGVAVLLSLTTVSDGFIYLLLKDKVGISASLFPLLFVGTSAAYLLLAIPLGRLADRVGRTRIFLAGHAIAALGYLALWLLPAGPWLVFVVLALIGTYYAATDGVLPALTVPLVPRSVRGSGIAGVQTVMAVGALGSAVLFGSLWSRFSATTAVATFGVTLLVVVGLAALLLRGVERRTHDHHEAVPA